MFVIFISWIIKKKELSLQAIKTNIIIFNKFLCCWKRFMFTFDIFPSKLLPLKMFLKLLNMNIICGTNWIVFLSQGVSFLNHLSLYYYFYIYYFIISLGGLDLSQHGLDQDSRSRQFEKVDLDVKDNLNTLKKLVSTLRTFSTVQKPSLDSPDYSKNQDFSIFVEISIESLDLDSLKRSISMWWIISTL